MDTSFIPEWPPEPNNFVLFGLLLVAAVVAGYVARRTRVFPTITGFILVGFLLGPGGVGLLSSGMVAKGQVFVDAALGLILFELGVLLDLRFLRSHKFVLVTSLVESAASFALVYLALRLFDIAPIEAALAGALGVSASPAVLLLVSREFGASGPTTQRAFILVALNNIWAFLAFTTLFSLVHAVHDAGMGRVLLQPLYILCGSVLAAYVLWKLLIRTARLVGKARAQQFPLTVGIIFLAVGIAEMLGISSLLTLLLLGTFARNLDRENELEKVEFGSGGEMLFAVLFVLAGANLHVQYLALFGLAVAAFVIARVTGKMLGVLLLSHLDVLPRRHSVALGLAMVPMAGLAIGLTQSASALYPAVGYTLSGIVFGAVVVLETLGPAATEFALKLANEVAPNSKIGH